MKRLVYIGFLFGLLAIGPVLIGSYNGLYAQELTFTTGEKLSHSLSVCLDKADAIEIADAHRKGGRAAAELVWQSKQRCQNIIVAKGEVGKAVYATNSDVGVLTIVEIVIDGKVEGYFLTSSPVNKPQRNT